jgi:hypothetical protein
MGETARGGKPPDPQVEERWKEVIEVLNERPRDPAVLVQAGELSEQLSRPLEAYNYYHKALTLDPSKNFLVSRLRYLASTQAQKDEVTKISRRPASFTAGLSSVFAYPLKGKGLPILVMGALLLWIGRALAGSGMGRSGFTIAVLLSAYMAMFYIDVCHTTVGGDDELPDFPDPLRLQEFGIHVGKFVLAAVVSFLPVVVIVIFAGSALFSADEREMAAIEHPSMPSVPARHDVDDDDDAPAGTPAPAPAPKPLEIKPEAPKISPLAGTMILSAIGIFVFAIAGLYYLPMATLANVVMGSPFTCFNFPFIFKSMGASKDYLICFISYVLTWGVFFGAEFVVKAANIMLFGGFILAFIELYGMTVLMRELGLFYRMNQAKLGWMAD